MKLSTVTHDMKLCVYERQHMHLCIHTYKLEVIEHRKAILLDAAESSWSSKFRRVTSKIWDMIPHKKRGGCIQAPSIPQGINLMFTQLDMHVSWNILKEKHPKYQTTIIT